MRSSSGVCQSRALPVVMDKSSLEKMSWRFASCQSQRSSAVGRRERPLLEQGEYRNAKQQFVLELLQEQIVPEEVWEAT
jgi:hypothetical protein